MSKPLIIYFHDEQQMAQEKQSSFLSTMHQIADDNSVGVTNTKEFGTLLKYLPRELPVYVFVHLMGDLQARNPGKGYPGEAWGLSLDTDYPNCRYFFVTTNISQKIKTIENKEVYGLHELFRETISKQNTKISPQKICEIIPETDNVDVVLPSPISSKDVDFVIITALYYDELEQIKVAFKIKNNSQIKIGSCWGYLFIYNGLRIIAVSQPQMGMVDSSILTTECILEFNPKYLIMPGVCGGDKKTNFGDVVIPDKIHLFQSGKLVENGFLKESVNVKIDHSIIEKIKPFEKQIVKEISNEIRRSKPRTEKFSEFLDKKFETRMLPMACSTMVIDKKDFFDDVIKEISRKMVAVEMESYGVARATEHIVSRAKCLIVKCVMDKTKTKKDSAKEYAAFISAQFIKKLIDKKILD